MNSYLTASGDNGRTQGPQMFKKDLLTTDINTSTSNSLHVKRISGVGVEDFMKKKQAKTNLINQSLIKKLKKKDAADHDACLSRVLGSTAKNIARTSDFAMELKATEMNRNSAL
jgi:hypothetical protein